MSDLASLPEGSRAMLVFQHSQINHIVAIDRGGVIDPRDDPPEYKSVDNFREIFEIEGWQLPYPNFWLVRKRNAV